jgi:sulfide:quinone oxidoreductase
VGTAMEKVEPGLLYLENGRTLAYKYAIVIPPFKGVDAILDSPGIGDQRGFIPVNDRYQHQAYANIYAAGVAVQVKPPEPTPIPTAVPKTGWMTEVMAKVAAHNIAAEITGGEPEEKAFADIAPLCIMDAGSNGMIITLDRVFKPRRFELMIPGPWSHWAKIGFEKYYMTKMRRGMVRLP